MEPGPNRPGFFLPSIGEELMQVMLQMRKIISGEVVKIVYGIVHAIGAGAVCWT